MPTATPSIDIEAEADFYNVRVNRHQILGRDGHVCFYCGKPLGDFLADRDRTVKR